MADAFRFTILCQYTGESTTGYGIDGRRLYEWACRVI